MVKNKQIKFPCSVCSKNVSKCSKALRCSSNCSEWTHFKCTNLSLEEYVELSKTKNWVCDNCTVPKEEEEEEILAHNITSTLVEEVESLNRIVVTLNNDLEEAYKKIQSLQSEKITLENLLLRREEEIIKLESSMNKNKSSLKLNATLPSDFCLPLRNKFQLLGENTNGHNSEFSDSDFPPLQTPKSFSHKSLQNRPVSKYMPKKHKVMPAVEKSLSSGPTSFKNAGTLKESSRKCCHNYNCGNCKPATNIDDTLNKDSVNDEKKLLICSDSHGRGLSWYVNKNQSTRHAVGFVRPGGRSDDVLNHKNITSELKNEDDVLVIICGSNDISKNEADTAIARIEYTIKKMPKNKIILVDLPNRYDLPLWSCVNELQKKTNLSLKELSNLYNNVTLVEISKAARPLHTRHGLHLNSLGKSWLAELICDAIDDNNGEISSAPGSSPPFDGVTPLVPSTCTKDTASPLKSLVSSTSTPAASSSNRMVTASPPKSLVPPTSTPATNCSNQCMSAGNGHLPTARLLLSA